MPVEDVYGSASGPLARIAGRPAAWARARRYAQLTTMTGLRPEHRVLDLGCGSLGLRAHFPEHDITGVDLLPRPAYPGPFVQADVAAGLPWEGGAFDLVVASSLIEHVPPERRGALAAEIRRLGRGYLVQTPAWSFPLEPHALLPAAHWLPVRLRRPYWRLGAQGDWEDIRLLRRGEMVARFPEAHVHAERVGPLAKSWLAVRPIPA